MLITLRDRIRQIMAEPGVQEMLDTPVVDLAFLVVEKSERGLFGALYSCWDNLTAQSVLNSAAVNLQKHIESSTPAPINQTKH